MAEPINLEFQEGWQVAITGDNASGKTRLVEVLTGHYPLLLNEVRYDFGSSCHRLVSENLKYITFRDSYGDNDGTYYLQQRWNQHDIDENTPTVGQLLDRIPEAVPGLREKLYALFHISDILDKYIISISSGELRKFQLTRTLLSAPRILILDNPFIGLDFATRDLLSDLLRSLTQETQLMVILLLSKDDHIPDFITHVLPIKDLHVLPILTREQYLESRLEPSLHLTQEEMEWILSLPEKDMSQVPFYPAQGGEILRFNDVSIRYGSRTILNSLNWSVREGERWALQGQNGAGKSTLLSLVCADNPQAYACDIELFGHKRGSGESIWEIKRHIGYVSPEMHRAYQKDIPAIDIVASGLSDSVGLYCRPKPQQREQCLGWMRTFGIEHLADRTFLRLSSGEQRLCLLARAFVKDPELLILDEPLHGLDLNQCSKVKEIIDTFAQRAHKTIIMVTHYREELPACITLEKTLVKNY